MVDSLQLPPLNWVRAFEAAARHGSFAGAAPELALTPAAVGYQVKSLEQFLGYALFQRHPRGLSLTDHGLAYLPQVRSTLEALSVATAGIFGRHGEAAVTVRAPVSLATLWLAGHLQAFCRAYPHFGVRLFSSIWADSLPDDKVDVDIRFGHGDWPGLRTQRLVNDPAVVVVAADWGPIRIPDLDAGSFIRIMGMEDVWQDVLRQSGVPLVGAASGPTVDTSLAALELVAAGVGAAVVLSRFAAVYERRGLVHRLPGLAVEQPQSHYLVTRDRDPSAHPEALIFTDWLKQQLRATA